MQIEARLKEMGTELPPAVTPVANYVPAVRTGNLVFLSGHGPFKEDGSLITGKVGADLTVEQGYEAARRIAIGLLGSLKAEIVDLDRVKRVVKLLGLVNCTLNLPISPRSSTVLRTFWSRCSAKKANTPAPPWERTHCRSTLQWKSK